MQKNEKDSRRDLNKVPEYIWDSRDYRPKDAFALFREDLCPTGGVVASLLSDEITCDGFTWYARDEMKRVERGSVHRSQMCGIAMKRGHREISHSGFDHFLGVWNLLNPMPLLRNEAKVIKPGDLIVCDMSYPHKVTSDQPLETLAFRIPKGAWPKIDENKETFRDLVVERDKISAPLQNCLHLLADRLMHSNEEVNAVFEALLNLLLIDAGCFGFEDMALRGKNNAIYSEILLFIDRHFSDPNLSVKAVAEAFSISERHVYRLLAERGLSFVAHLKHRRIQKAAVELRTNRHIQITDVALKCGFNDLSTFSRAFKQKFGCCPHDFQKQY
jgi:excisionase family DNA binding protein